MKRTKEYSLELAAYFQREAAAHSNLARWLLEKGIIGSTIDQQERSSYYYKMARQLFSEATE